VGWSVGLGVGVMVLVNVDQGRDVAIAGHDQLANSMWTNSMWADSMWAIDDVDRQSLPAAFTAMVDPPDFPGEDKLRPTTARLVALGLLQRRPMSGYEVCQAMVLSRVDRWAGLLPGSIYHALPKMESEGLLRAVAEERIGNRVRKTYAITPAGRATMCELLREALSRPARPVRSDLALAATWIDLLDADEAVELLAGARLAVQRAQRDRAARRRVSFGLTPITEVLLENEEAVAAADLLLLERIGALVAARRSACAARDDALGVLRDTGLGASRGT
jgi:DNA-binding PadR family transcriptional regulator